MQRIKPITNEIYHVYNRGVEKRNIFLDDQDRFRFIHDLFEFNDEALAINLRYKKSALQFHGVQHREIGGYKKEPRKFIVEILAFCIMPNHFHLMLMQKVDGGISQFMKKMGGGYTNYFNQKYKHSGHVFQGKYKFIQIKRDAHFTYLPYYIHLNPLDLVMPRWKEKGVDVVKAATFLEQYRWSSYLDYIGEKNFPSITQRESLLEFFNGPKQYKKDMMQWLKGVELESIKSVILE